MTNTGLIDIRDQIFGQLDHKTLKNCREVFAQKYGEDWDLWLEKLILVKYILEFGYKENEYGQIVIEIIPGLDKAVKKFSKMASLNDLNQVEESLKGLLEDFYERWPLHYAA